MKQGAVLGPLLFAAYLDPLTEGLRLYSVVYHTGNIYANVFEYANALLLLLPARNKVHF